MRPLIHPIATAHTPESLVDELRGAPGVVLLRTAAFESAAARYSLVAARPFLTFRSWGSRCEIFHDVQPGQTRAKAGDDSSGPGEPGLQVQFGNPWHILDALMARC